MKFWMEFRLISGICSILESDDLEKHHIYFLTDILSFGLYKSKNCSSSISVVFFCLINFYTRFSFTVFVLFVFIAFLL